MDTVLGWFLLIAVLAVVLIAIPLAVANQLFSAGRKLRAGRRSHRRGVVQKP